LRCACELRPQRLDTDHDTTFQSTVSCACACKAIQHSRLESDRRSHCMRATIVSVCSPSSGKRTPHVQGSGPTRRTGALLSLILSRLSDHLGVVRGLIRPSVTMQSVRIGSVPCREQTCRLAAPPSSQPHPTWTMRSSDLRRAAGAFEDRRFAV
jgi:hypothetical protein